MSSEEQSPLMEPTTQVTEDWKHKIMKNKHVIVGFILVAVVVLIVLNKDKVCNLAGIEVVKKSKKTTQAQSKSQPESCDWNIDKEILLLEAKQAACLKVSSS